MENRENSIENDFKKVDIITRQALEDEPKTSVCCLLRDISFNTQPTQFDPLTIKLTKLNDKPSALIHTNEESNNLLKENDGMSENIENISKHGNNEETECGIGCLKGPRLQKFANKKAYVILYGLLGCTFSASFAYFNGTITTLEKRFKIPSRTTGIISVGNDLSQLLMSVILSYYTGRGHRPRWMALGMYTVVLFCLLTALPHFLYGPGLDSLLLTEEYQHHEFVNSSGHLYKNILRKQQEKFLCHEDDQKLDCDFEEGNFSPQVILFVAQFISGIGGSLYYTLGISYMDDNIRRSKTPALFSFSYFLRMLGPALGHALSSICLRLYVSPDLTPKINNNDPRWVGAWWLGWIVLAMILFIFSSLLTLFPKTLPRAAKRKEILKKQSAKLSPTSIEEHMEPEQETSLKDMVRTFARLVKNRILMLNNFAAIFYFLGYMPYWIFLPKYIETQYRQSASTSSFITGSAGLIFSAIGILLSGFIISKFRPRARYLAAWNVIVGAISFMGIVSYAFLGCPENDVRNTLATNERTNAITECNSHCHCDYVKYNPVCASDGKTTFVSACHAGCNNVTTINGTEFFTNCSCITSKVQNKALNSGHSSSMASNMYNTAVLDGFVHQGSCQVDCLYQFYMFLCVVCLLKFSGATGRASNFLVTVRCVEEKDKAVAMGFGLMMMSLCAFIPSPILFGIILDKACLVWGRTCKGTGNCWLYNGATLRYTINFTAAGFIFIGTVFDAGVWYFVKNLQIFEEEYEMEDLVDENIVEDIKENICKT